ncbi:unnamed protein product [Agarophyton chilense]
MSVYLRRINIISSVVAELNVSRNDVSSQSVHQQKTLAEFLRVLAELRRVARQLEADKKVLMSRAPRLLRELYQTFLEISGDILPSAGSLEKHEFTVLLSDQFVDVIEARALATRTSYATAESERAKGRIIRLRFNIKFMELVSES